MGVNFFTVYGTLSKGVLYYGDKALEIDNWRHFSDATRFWNIAVNELGKFYIIRGLSV